MYVAAAHGRGPPTHADTLIMRNLLRGMALAAGLLATATQLHAQAYPARPVTVIWPYAAGSGTGLAHKKWMEMALGSLGQPVLFEYRGGAGARLGQMAVAKAPPDGYLLSFTNDAVLTIAPLALSSF